MTADKGTIGVPGGRVWYRYTFLDQRAAGAEWPAHPRRCATMREEHN